MDVHPQQLASSCYSTANAERFARVHIFLAGGSVFEPTPPLPAWEIRTLRCVDVDVGCLINTPPQLSAFSHPFTSPPQGGHLRLPVQHLVRRLSALRRFAWEPGAGQSHTLSLAYGCSVNLLDLHDPYGPLTHQWGSHKGWEQFVAIVRGWDKRARVSVGCQPLWWPYSYVEQGTCTAHPLPWTRLRPIWAMAQNPPP